MSRLLCFGLGYSARTLARRVSAQGWRIDGTTRSQAGAEALGKEGFNALVFDGTAQVPAVSEALRSATHVLVSAPPDADGDPVLRRHRDDLAAAPDLQWVGYLSTVGVYGDHQGAWVDEATPVNPKSQRSRQRVHAEGEWLSFAADTGKRVQVFRLSGIYGPGRSAIDKLRAGKARAIVKPDQVFNRIHVEDIANVLEACIEGRGAQAIYNVTDDEPSPPQDVIAHAAELLNVPAPPEIAFDDAQLSPMAASFYGENKRVSNARLREDLRLTLDFPSYREGLRAILANA